jgi:LPXTG-motif cell wall-anchored protein
MYVDPSTGGILFQVLAGILAMLSGILFFFSRKIREGFARMRRKIRGDGEDQEFNPSKDVHPRAH